MSSIKIGFVIMVSLIAFSTSASAEIRYAGSPKFGQFITSQSAAAADAAVVVPNRSKAFDARAQMLGPQTHMYKGGIAARGL